MWRFRFVCMWIRCICKYIQRWTDDVAVCFVYGVYVCICMRRERMMMWLHLCVCMSIWYMCV